MTLCVEAFLTWSSKDIANVVLSVFRLTSRSNYLELGNYKMKSISIREKWKLEKPSRIINCGLLSETDLIFSKYTSGGGRT